MKTLKKTHVVIVLIVLIMGNNITHSASLYQMLSGENYWKALFAMFILDAAVIVSALYARGVGDQRLSALFAWLLFLCNFFFWGGLQDVYFFENTMSDPKIMTLFVTKIMFSGVFAFTIHHFSYLYRDLSNQEQQTSKIEQELSKIEQGMSESKQRTQQVLATAKQAHTEHQALRQLMLERTEQNTLFHELQNQLAEAHKETARINALYQIDIAERTLYCTDNDRLYQNAKAVVGAMAGMPVADREYHLAKKKQVIEYYQEML